jgi:1,4-dihydroxy-2-naphthoate octaprenyltransferase
LALGCKEELDCFDEQLAATSSSQTSALPRTFVDLVLTLLLLLILVKFMQTSISLSPSLFGRIIVLLAWLGQANDIPISFTVLGKLRTMVLSLFQRTFGSIDET